MVAWLPSGPDDAGCGAGAAGVDTSPSEDESQSDLSSRPCYNIYIFFQTATNFGHAEICPALLKTKGARKSKDNNNNNSNLVNPFCTNPAWILSYESSR